jgi:hypothetical protein
MSDSDTSGFGKFVPGFDFLQNLAKGASSSIPQMPNLGNWVAPTLNVEELDKRIEELKNVHFWLEQNSRALAATIQALEVQKMTLATLKGMNFNIGDVANAFKLKAADSLASGMQRAADKVTQVVTPEPEPEPDPEPAPVAKPAASKKTATKGGTPMGVVDPLQLWGSLAQQFQNIAAGAMKEATTKSAVDITRNMATGLAKEAIKSVKAAGKKAVSRKAPAKRRANSSATRRAPARKTSR